MSNTTVVTCACGSSRWMEIYGECTRELYTCINVNGTKQTYNIIPRESNLGADECISFTVCMNCGKIQGEWPVKQDIALTNDNLINLTTEAVSKVTYGRPPYPAIVTFGPRSLLEY